MGRETRASRHSCVTSRSGSLTAGPGDVEPPAFLYNVRGEGALESH